MDSNVSRKVHTISSARSLYTFARSAIYSSMSVSSKFVNLLKERCEERFIVFDDAFSEKGAKITDNPRYVSNLKGHAGI